MSTLADKAGKAAGGAEEAAATADMLRKCAPLLRIGVHLDPRAAGFGTSIPVNVVAGSGLSHEAGFRSSLPTDAQRQVQRQAEAGAARDALRSRLTAPADDGSVPASASRAAALIAGGCIDDGLAMVAAVDASPAHRLTSDDLIALLDGLSIPDVVAALYEQTHHNLFEAYKRAGSHRGTQRVREAEHLFNRLKHAVADDFASDEGEQLRAGFNALMKVYLTAGYDHCLRIPDQLYDRMYFEQIQPSAQTYSHVLAALGITTRMQECEALWSWLHGSHRGKLPYSVYVVMLNAYCEAERFLDVSRLFHDIALMGNPKPDARALDILVRSIYQHSRHAGGTIPASEEKKLVFIPTYARQCGVHMADLSEKHQELVQNAVKRWTYRRGLDKTVRWMLDEREYEYRAWNDGQRWSHTNEDEVNTSMMEAGVRKMRGHSIDQRMRLDVEKGGGRGVIYPPESHYAVTRYDSATKEERRAVLWDQLGVSQTVIGKTPGVPDHADVVKQLQFARRSATAERAGGSGSVWRRR